MTTFIETGNIPESKIWWWSILAEELYYMDPNCDNNPATLLTEHGTIMDPRLIIECHIWSFDLEFPYVDSPSRLKVDCERNIGFHAFGSMGNGDHEFYRSVMTRVTNLGQFQAIRNWTTPKNLNELDDFLNYVICAFSKIRPQDTRAGFKESASGFGVTLQGLFIEGKFYQFIGKRNGNKKEAQSILLQVCTKDHWNDKEKKWSCPLVELEDFERKVEGVRDYRLRDRGRDFIEIVGEIGWEMEKSDCKKNIEVRPVPS